MPRNGRGSGSTVREAVRNFAASPEVRIVSHNASPTALAAPSVKPALYVAQLDGDSERQSRSPRQYGQKSMSPGRQARERRLAAAAASQAAREAAEANDTKPRLEEAVQLEHLSSMLKSGQIHNMAKVSPPSNPLQDSDAATPRANGDCVQESPSQKKTFKGMKRIHVPESSSHVQDDPMSSVTVDRDLTPTTLTTSETLMSENLKSREPSAAAQMPSSSSPSRTPTSSLAHPPKPQTSVDVIHTPGGGAQGRQEGDAAAVDQSTISPNSKGNLRAGAEALGRHLSLMQEATLRLCTVSGEHLKAVAENLSESRHQQAAVVKEEGSEGRRHEIVYQFQMKDLHDKVDLALEQILSVKEHSTTMYYALQDAIQVITCT
jgi:hypothetical protein